MILNIEIAKMEFVLYYGKINGLIHFSKWYVFSFLWVKYNSFDD